MEVSVELMKVLHLELALENYLEPMNLLAKSKALELLIDLVTPLVKQIYLEMQKVKVLEMALDLVVLHLELAMDYVG